jgi:hypothetical protein
MTNDMIKLQAQIDDLARQSGGLLSRINEAQQVASAAQVPADRVAALREKRHKLLGDCYLHLADAGDLTAVNKELAAAEVEERAANEAREGAQAAAERLTAEHEAIRLQLVAMHQQLPGVLYRAHCERAAESIGPFRAALEQLAKAHAVLQGRLLAADKFADPRAGRAFVAGGLVSSFASTLPAIPGHMEREEVTFNMAADIEAEFSASLTSLGGAGAAEAAQRQRIEAAANEAERAMRVAMAAVGAS